VVKKKVAAKKKTKAKKPKVREESTAKQAAKESTESAKQPVDRARMRDGIDQMVWDSAEVIAKKVIDGARDGQVAAAKYLFEAVGLYPATEETKANMPEQSLPYALLRRISLATDQVIRNNESERPSGDVCDFPKDEGRKEKIVRKNIRASNSCEGQEPSGNGSAE
jgi:hypothetical protein